MISREEYNKALDIVEAYNKQLFIGVVSSSLRDSKTTILDWIEINDCSYRLYQGLKAYHYYIESKKGQVFIEDITNREFGRIRNLGRKSWREFEKLRGN